MSGNFQKLRKCTEIFVTINENRLQLLEVIDQEE